MIGKKGFEFSFGWLFSIVVGIAFIFMAIYIAVSILDFGDSASAAENAKQFGILLNPIETGLEEGKKSSIYFNTDTRIYFDCNNIGEFGNQEISTAIQATVGGNWNRPGTKVSFNNKYIFSKNVVEGKKIIVFSKPFVMPYKIADLIYVWSEDDRFCFVDAPQEIKKDVEGFAINEINLTDEQCPKESVEVCFSKSGCDIDVSLAAGTVKKFKSTLYYIDDSNNALIYAAIFADPGIYECQMNRLMDKNAALAEVYLEKTQFLGPRGCNSNLDSELGVYSNVTGRYNGSIELRSILDLSKELDRRNDALSCKLF